MASSRWAGAGNRAGILKQESRGLAQRSVVKRRNQKRRKFSIAGGGLGGVLLTGPKSFNLAIADLRKLKLFYFIHKPFLLIHSFLPSALVSPDSLSNQLRVLPHVPGSIIKQHTHWLPDNAKRYPEKVISDGPDTGSLQLFLALAASQRH